MAIKGVHAMFYSDAAEETRAFLRDKVGLGDHFDAGDGWLIFNFAQADLGVHPLGHPGAPPTGTHYVSLFTDDLEAEVAGMRERGVEFLDEIKDMGYALAIHFMMPGGIKVELYEPKY